MSLRKLLRAIHSPTHGLDPVSIYVLTELSFREGVSKSMLARRCGHGPSRIDRPLLALRRAGHVEISNRTQRVSGQPVSLTVTEKGRGLLASLNKALMETQSAP